MLEIFNLFSFNFVGFVSSLIAFLVNGSSLIAFLGTGKSSFETESSFTRYSVEASSIPSLQAS